MQVNDIGINIIKHPKESSRYVTRMKSDLAIETCLQDIKTNFWVMGNLTHVLILSMFASSPKNPRFIPLGN